MDGNALCVLEGVRADYGSSRRGGGFSLGPVTLSLYPGEILGLRGPNGAGKSTLIKLMAGVLRPREGRVWRPPELKNRVAYVPQEIALYQSLSGMDNLRFWGGVYGLPRRAREARAKWLLEQLGLSRKGGDPVSSYSGGMCRRLHLATALMGTPRLLLLDEPTVGADPESVERILSLLERCRSPESAVVWTTHQAGELERLSTRILTLGESFRRGGNFG